MNPWLLPEKEVPTIEMRLSLNSSVRVIRFTKAGHVYDLIPLNLLSRGQMGVVDQVVGHPEQVHQLEERGLRGGTEVEVLGRNGDTCMIRLVSGATIGVRTNQGTAILVRLRASA